MGTQTRTLLAVVALAVLVVLAGCADSDSTGPRDGPGEGPSAETIQAEAAAVAGNLSSAAFSMTMTIDSAEESLSLQSNGVVNVDDRRMRTNITLESGGRTVEVTQYIVDQRAYQERDGKWQRLDLNGTGIWAGGNQLRTQARMLENSALNVTGTAVVAGNETWVVSIEPTEASIQQFLTGTATGVAENLEFQNESVTMYIDTDTYEVRKLELGLETETDGDTARLELSQTFSRFDEAVDIQLPEAATP